MKLSLACEYTSLDCRFLRNKTWNSKGLLKNLVSSIVESFLATIKRTDAANCEGTELIVDLDLLVSEGQEQNTALLLTLIPTPPKAVKKSLVWQRWVIAERQFCTCSNEAIFNAKFYARKAQKTWTFHAKDVLSLRKNVLSKQQNVLTCTVCLRYVFPAKKRRT